MFATDISLNFKKLHGLVPYNKSVLLTKLETLHSNQLPLFAIITDYDNSLFHKATAQKTRELLSKAAEDSTPVVVVTGNSLSKLKERCESQKIPLPDVALTSVGTEIWVKQHNETFLEDEQFALFSQTDGFSRKEIVQRMHDFIDQANGEGIQFQFQNPEQEKSFLAGEDIVVEGKKISTHFFAFKKELPVIIERFKTAFSEYPMIWCEEVDYNDEPENARQIEAGTHPKKYCADVLAVTPKAAATNYLIDLCGFQDALVVGDSGNDLDLLKLTTIGTSVMVAGSKSELQERLLAEATKVSDLAQQQNGLDVYMLQNGRLVLHITSKDPNDYAAASIFTALQFYQKYLT